MCFSNSLQVREIGLYFPGSDDFEVDLGIRAIMASFQQSGRIQIWSREGLKEPGNAWQLTCETSVWQRE